MVLWLNSMYTRRRRRFWHATHDCVAPYVDIILHRERFWAKSAASGSVRWCCFRSCWTVLSHVMREWPSFLLQSAGGEANRILLASALWFMRIMCPNRVTRCDWIIAVSLGCFVRHRTSLFWTNWYRLMPSSLHRPHVNPIYYYLNRKTSAISNKKKQCPENEQHCAITVHTEYCVELNVTLDT